MQIRFIIALVFSIMVTVFALLNAQTTEVNLIFSSVRLSLALVILSSAAVGALIAGLLSAFKQISAMWKIRNLENQIKQQNDTIAELKKAVEIPVATSEPIAAPLETEVSTTDTLE